MEQTINIKNIIFGILFKWKIIIAVAVLVAVCLASVMVYKEKSNSGIAPTETAISDYNKQKETYERELATLKRDYDSTIEYSEESLLMGFDTYNIYTARIEIYVDSLYEILTDKSVQSPDNINKLISAYDNKFKYGYLYDDILDVLGLDISTKYIQEFVVITSNVTNSNIIIDIKMDNQSDLNSVINAIVSYVNKSKTSIQTDVADHEISIITNSVNELIDDALKTSQVNLETQIFTQANNIDAKETQIEGLSEPTTTVVSTSSLVTTGLKYGVLGGVVGAILVAGCIFVIMLLSNKLQDEEFVEEVLKTQVLGVKPIIKKNAIDKLLAKMYEKTLLKTEDEFYDYIVENIKSLNKDGKKLHITGSISTEEITEVYNKISSKLGVGTSYGMYLMQDKGSLIKLGEADGVVLIEKRNGSNVTNIYREMKYVENAGKQVLGVVIL